MVLVPLIEVGRPARRHGAPDADRHGVNHLLELLFAPPQCLDAFVQCEHRLLVLPRNGGYDQSRERRNDQKKLQHDLVVLLGNGIAGKLAGAGYREYRRDQRKQDQGDCGAPELKAHRGPKKRRHDDVGEGQVTAQGEGGNAEKDQPQDASFDPSRGRKPGRAAPVLEHDQRQRRHDQDPGCVADPP